MNRLTAPIVSFIFVALLMGQISCAGTGADTDASAGAVMDTRKTSNPGARNLFAIDPIGTLEENRKRWQDSGVKNYKMTVEIQKPGHATPMGKFIITVRNGVLESTQFASDLKPVPDQVRFGSYKTVDQIFDYAAAMLKQDAKWSRKVMEFDPKLGYPKRVDLNIQGSLDEEIFIEVLEFEELK